MTSSHEKLAIALDTLLQTTAVNLRQHGISYSEEVKSSIIEGIRSFLYNLDDELTETELRIDGDLINDQSFEAPESIAAWLKENSQVSQKIASLEELRR